MPQFAPIDLMDGQSTPVEHTFAPASLQTNGGKVIASFEDRSPATIAGYNRLRVERSPENANGMFKMRFVIERATLETLSNDTSSGIAPAPTLAYTTTGVIEVWAHRRSTLNERKDVIAYLASLVADTSIETSIENLEAFY
jgi:hypothetical protein